MTLELTGVSVSRGAGDVVTDVSLTVSPGKVTVVLGANGAGKTSLLEAVSGIIAARAGSISLQGTDVSRWSRRRRARAGIAHVEQGRAIFPSLTVRENLDLGSRAPVVREEVLALFPELEKRMDSRAELLSGGEQQMLVLGRAFATRPQFLLIDEMSLGLAPIVFLRLLPVIEGIAASGVGVLLVEQFARLALGVAADAHVLANGRSTYTGSASELLADPTRLLDAYLGTDDRESSL